MYTFIAPHSRARGADDGGRRRRDASYGVARDSHPVSTTAVRGLLVHPVKGFHGQVRARSQGGVYVAGRNPERLPLISRTLRLARIKYASAGAAPIGKPKSLRLGIKPARPGCGVTLIDEEKRKGDHADQFAHIISTGRVRLPFKITAASDLKQYRDRRQQDKTKADLACNGCNTDGTEKQAAQRLSRA